MKSFVKFFFLMCFFVHRSHGIKEGTAVTKANYVAAVLDNKLQATGSVINQRFVLTAASFIEDGKKYRVKIGSTDVKADGIEIEVDSFIKHDQDANDIALLKLKEDIPDPKPADLPTEATTDVADAVVFGWGKLATRKDNNVLVQGTVALKEKADVCVAGIGAGDRASLFCFDKTRYQKEDVGAPLTAKDKSNIVIALATKEHDDHRYFTPIFPYIQWITDNSKEFVESSSNDPDPTSTTGDGPEPTSTTGDGPDPTSTTGDGPDPDPTSTTGHNPNPTSTTGHNPTKTPGPDPTKTPDTTKAPVTTKKPTPKKKSSAPLSSSLNLKLLIAFVSARLILMF